MSRFHKNHKDTKITKKLKKLSVFVSLWFSPRGILIACTTDRIENCMVPNQNRLWGGKRCYKVRTLSVSLMIGMEIR
jgi:hypothetical protein